MRYLAGAPCGVVGLLGRSLEEHIRGLEVCVQDAQLVQIVHAHGHIQQPQQQMLLHDHKLSQSSPAALLTGYWQDGPVSAVPSGSSG